MKLRAFIQSVRKKGTPPEELAPEAVLGFLRVLENLEKEEISCNELYVKLDEYVEREVDKKDAAELMPLMREHLDICPDCCEEYEALLHVIEENDKKTPE
jgi:hypothetical protein